MHAPHSRVRKSVQVPGRAGIGEDDRKKHRRGTYQVVATALISLPRAHYPRAALAAQGSNEIQGATSVVNAVSLLRADAAHEPALQPALRECVARAVRRYLADVESQPREGLHALVLHEVESPLLGEVLAWYGGNQSKAAAALGINRATLRKKLHQYGLTD
jgi:Fis family transcriptional regulator, factor for inversion stimulation protein